MVIYYLATLEKGKFYVGMTEREWPLRASEHEQSTKGWTSIYKPLNFEIYKETESRTYEEADLFFKTVMKYGIENVRGFNLNAFVLKPNKVISTADFFKCLYINSKEYSRDQIDKMFSWKRLPPEQKLVNVYNPIEFEKQYFFLLDFLIHNQENFIEWGYNNVPSSEIKHFKEWKNHFLEIWSFIQDRLDPEIRNQLINCSYIKNYKGKLPDYHQLSEIFFMI